MVLPWFLVVAAEDTGPRRPLGKAPAKIKRISATRLRMSSLRLEPVCESARPISGFSALLGPSAPMKIVLFALLGLALGALGGAALGIGAGLAWVDIFKTTSFEGYSGMLVFLAFMPAAPSSAASAMRSVRPLAFRDNKIAIEREPVRRKTCKRLHDRPNSASMKCKMRTCISADFDYLKLQIMALRLRRTATMTSG